MARARTVLTPAVVKPEKPPKPTPLREVPTSVGRTYRSRRTAEGPWGGFDRPFYSDDLAAVERIALSDRAAGFEVVVERRCLGGYAPLNDSVHEGAA